MREIHNGYLRDADCQRGIWSVDHIVCAEDCPVFIDNQSFSGYLMRLIKYKKNPTDKVGLKYLLVGKDLHLKIRVGNTYYFPETVYEVRPATINRIEHKIWYLTAVPDKAVEVRDILTTSIQLFFNEAENHESSGFTKENAHPLSVTDKRKIWARIHVLHVGQGDTIVLELPDNQLWMIDARFWPKERLRLFDDWMRDHLHKQSIDRLIISHFHYDHIRSIPDVIQKYKPKQVVVTKSLLHATAATRRALHYAGNQLYIARNDEITQLGNLSIRLNTTAGIENLGNNADPNYHEVSVIMESENGIAFLAGDIPDKLCHKLLATKYPKINSYRIRLYKVSHHGSGIEYDKNLIDYFKPNKSIISCGQGNRYGHPHRPPSDRLIPELKVTWKDGQNVYSYDI